MKVDIGNLLQLQIIDLQINKLDEEMADGVAEIEKRQATIEGRRTTIAELQAKLGACEKRRRELDADLEDETGRIKERQTKLMSVQTNREYQSLLKEIEEGKKANKQREDESVQLLEQEELLRARLEEQQNLCGAEEGLLDEASQKVESLQKELASKREDIVKSRDAKVKDVDASLLKRYELLRSRRNGKALAGVTDGVCKGCYMNIPPQLYIELQKAEQLLACPSCNRLMYHEKETEEA